MAPLKVGIAGFGRMGEYHCRKLQALAQFRVCSVCDPSPERRHVAGATYGLTANADLAAFLGGEMDAVVVTTHTGVHYAVGSAALRAGKHVLMEKPLAANAQEAGELVALAETNRLVLTVYYNRRWNPDYCKIKPALWAGMLGDIFYVENRFSDLDAGHTFGTPEFYPHWRISKGMGGGTILDIGSHWFDQVLDLLPGRVVEITADVRNVLWGDADDYFSAFLTFDTGTRALVTQCSLRSVPVPKWVIHGSRASLVAQGIEGDVAVVEPRRNVTLEVALPKVDLHRNFYEAIVQEAPLQVTGAQALRVSRLVDACLESSSGGRATRVAI